jgi:hypothetical protein
VCKSLGLPESSFSDYLYWNTLEQMLCFAYGIAVKDLLKCKKMQPLISAFTLADQDGKHPTDQYRRQFQLEKFTPEFYPRRFLLKKILFEQDMVILDLLLRYALETYAASNVSYVEFSIGMSDLTKPWIAPFLFFNLGKIDTKINHRFLAGFPRGKVCLDGSSIYNYQVTGRWTQLRDLVTKYGRLFGEEGIMEHVSFSLLEADVKALSQLLDTRCNAWQMIVGFDLFGDERYAPFVPFISPTFMDIARRWQKLNRNFGFRVHFGEVSVPTTSSSDVVEQTYLEVHLNIGCHAVSFLKNAAFPVRIGHGVAIAFLLEKKSKIIDMVSGCCIEICPSSNLQLLTNIEGTQKFSGDVHALTILKDAFPCVIGTDDDGILEELSLFFGRLQIKSLLVELYRLWKSGVLSLEEIYMLGKNSVRVAFFQHRNNQAVKKSHFSRWN